jgi:hypothetical protein
LPNAIIPWNIITSIISIIIVYRNIFIDRIVINNCNILIDIIYESGIVCVIDYMPVNEVLCL